MTKERVRISVEWGYEIHSITLTARNWAKVKAGKPLRIRGKGYWYDGEFFWDHWTFVGGYEGRLLVEYHLLGEWYGNGWDNALKDAEIETFTGAEPDSPPEIESVAIWFIEHDLSKPEQGFRLRRMLNGGGAPSRIAVDVHGHTGGTPQTASTWPESEHARGHHPRASRRDLAAIHSCCTLSSGHIHFHLA
jgi:hypothetical protein